MQDLQLPLRQSETIGVDMADDRLVRLGLLKKGLDLVEDVSGRAVFRQEQRGPSCNGTRFPGVGIQARNGNDILNVGFTLENLDAGKSAESWHEHIEQNNPCFVSLVHHLNSLAGIAGCSDLNANCTELTRQNLA